MDADTPINSEFMQPHEIVWLSDRPDRDALEVKLEEFWYSVYVEELGRQPSQAEHIAKRLPDPYLHSGGAFVALTQGGEVVATCLLNTNENISDLYRTLYQIPWTGAATDPNVSVCNKLMVKKSWRQKSSLSMDLVRAVYEWGLRHDIRYNYIHCVAYLKTYYQRLGYREHAGIINHPDYGERHTMVLDLQDHDYLASIRSPYAEVYARMRGQGFPEAGGANT